METVAVGDDMEMGVGDMVLYVGVTMEEDGAIVMDGGTIVVR
jgi:hypothetical protein